MSKPIVITKDSQFAPALKENSGIEGLKPGIVVKTPSGMKARLINSANVPNASKHLEGGKSRRSRRHKKRRGTRRRR
jgi:hypothetical protein